MVRTLIEGGVFSFDDDLVKIVQISIIVKVQGIDVSSWTCIILFGPTCQEAPAHSSIHVVSCQVQGGGGHASINLQSRHNIGISAEAEKEEGGVGVVVVAGEPQWRHLGRREREAHSPRWGLHLNPLHRWSPCPALWNVSPAGRSLPQRGGGAPVRWWDSVFQSPKFQSAQAASHQVAGLLLLQDYHCCSKIWISIQSAMNFVIIIITFATITGNDWLIFN